MGKKRIIICCDGTWNNPNQAFGTNVVITARAIVPKGKHGVEQVVFYDWGVGSEGPSTKLQGGTTGAGLDKNIQDGYRFLVHNYNPGDDIFLFGFSRGAYTARSTAGFIRNVGILKKENAGLIQKAYDMYRAKTHHPDSQSARDLRKKYCQKINNSSDNMYVPKIKFIGVWDTVGALGIPLTLMKERNKKKYAFHDTQLSSFVEYACHALAIDEKRVDFKPTLWTNKPSPGQTVHQSWFVGVHCDVGGSYKEHGLSDIALMWMLKHASKQGLVINKKYLKGVAEPNCLDKKHASREGLYKLKKTYYRPIGELPKSLEEIHQSVRKRYKQDKSYRPRKFVEYLGKR